MRCDCDGNLICRVCVDHKIQAAIAASEQKILKRVAEALRAGTRATMAANPQMIFARPSGAERTADILSPPAPPEEKAPEVDWRYIAEDFTSSDQVRAFARFMASHPSAEIVLKRCSRCARDTWRTRSSRLRTLRWRSITSTASTVRT